MMHEGGMTGMIPELRLQVRMASQVCIQMLCKKSVDIVAVIFLARLTSSHYLSAAGIATVTANVFGNSFIMGLGGPLSTLCSQAYGAKNFRALRLSFQQAIAIMTVLCSCITLLWAFSRPIIESLGQSEDIARDASQFLHCLIPALFSYAYAVCIQFCLYAQQKPTYTVFVSIIIAILHPFWCYFYMKTLNIGYLGAAYAISTSRVAELFLLAAYMSFSSDHEIQIQRQFKWTRESLTGWRVYFQLGAPNVLMMSEWWASEAIIFMAGFLSDPDVKIAAISIFHNVGSICFMLPRGLETAGCSRVGNAIGKKDALGALSASSACVFTQLNVSVIQSLVLVLCRNRIYLIFFNADSLDKRERTRLSNLMLMLALYTFADGLQCAMSGCLKGAGKQRICGPVVICCYFLVGLPVAALLAFTMSYEVLGLAVGTTVGTWLHFISYAIILRNINWILEADNFRQGVELKAAYNPIQLKEEGAE